MSITLTLINSQKWIISELRILYESRVTNGITWKMNYFLGRDVEHPTFFVIVLRSSGQNQDNSFNRNTGAFFHVLYKSLVTYYPSCRHMYWQHRLAKINSFLTIHCVILRCGVLCLCKEMSIVGKLHVHDKIRACVAHSWVKKWHLPTNI
jgi:hypothetical protein